jgi:UDP-GlcNAc:undecaprenyl-phosphate GlcNAc-1-phosphate transferase
VNGPQIAFVGCIVTLAVTPLMILTARRTGIVDRPGTLKHQDTPVPYLGGVAVFAGLAVGVFAAHWFLLVPLVGALCLGVADDRFELPPLIRLGGQVAIGVGIVVTSPTHLPGAAAALVVAVAVLLINGVNLIDGLDMLAAGTTAVAAVGFAIVVEGPGRQIAIALGAALVGFLVYNRPPARIYLGDGGSYLLGACLTILLVRAWGPTVPTATGVAALAMVALPVAEVAFAVVRRARGRLPLLAGDRGHPYDRLVTRGWSRIAASLTYIAAAALLTGAAVAAIHIGSMSAAVVVDLAATVVLVGAAWATGALVPVDGTRR